MSEKKEVKFQYTEYADAGTLPAKDFELLEAAEKVMAKAYAPYSHFHVGAAIRLDNQEIHIGNNQENAAYPSGLCAERVALFHAMALNPDAVVESVAIAAEAQDFELTRIITPCGACRQALLEYEVNSASPIRVVMGSTGGQAVVVESVLSLLPLSFCETKLRKH